MRTFRICRECQEVLAFVVDPTRGADATITAGLAGLAVEWVSGQPYLLLPLAGMDSVDPGSAPGDSAAGGTGGEIDSGQFGNNQINPPHHHHHHHHLTTTTTTSCGGNALSPTEMEMPRGTSSPCTPMCTTH